MLTFAQNHYYEIIVFTFNIFDVLKSDFWSIEHQPN
jgi:hypothetical protein